MSVRSLIAGALLLASVSVGGTVSAGGECSPTGSPGVQQCVAGIRSDQMDLVSARQEESQWCWAASISMIFAFHGHPISQGEIVRQTYGSEVNLPAGSGQTMTDALNREYVDANGKRFRATTRVFDMTSGQAEIDNAGIAAELRAGRPLLVGTNGHAMVVSAMTYLASPFAMQVTSVTVRDPWPASPGRRVLQWNEMQPTYVASVSVHDVSAPAGAEGLGAPPITQADDPCVASCDAERQSCLDTVTRLDECLDDYELNRCPTTCEESYGYSPYECAVLCQRSSTNVETWTRACNRQISAEKRECSEARSSCVASCTGD